MRIYLPGDALTRTRMLVRGRATALLIVRQPAASPGASFRWISEKTLQRPRTDGKMYNSIFTLIIEVAHPVLSGQRRCQYIHRVREEGAKRDQLDWFCNFTLGLQAPNCSRDK